jgi:murein DD-endopeptidase MepM/ murein hydrolase activator NlpD
MKARGLAAASVGVVLAAMFASQGFSRQAPVSATAWPVASGLVTSGFAGKHQGIDIAAPAGTPVLAFATGVVEARDAGKGCGERLRIRHEFGAMSVYCNLGGIRVAVGDIVARGATLAEVAAGTERQKPHLHFELEIGGEKVDPIAHLPRVPE